MLADFHRVGMTPDLRDRLNKCDKRTYHSFAQICKILDGILSTPGDLLMSRLHRIPCTSNGVVVTFSNKFGLTTSVVGPLTSSFA